MWSDLLGLKANPDGVRYFNEWLFLMAKLSDIESATFGWMMFLIVSAPASIATLRILRDYIRHKVDWRMEVIRDGMALPCTVREYGIEVRYLNKYRWFLPQEDPTIHTLSRFPKPGEHLGVWSRTNNQWIPGRVVTSGFLVEFGERGEIKQRFVNFLSTTETYNRVRLQSDPEKHIRPENAADIIYFYEQKRKFEVATREKIALLIAVNLIVLLAFWANWEFMTVRGDVFFPEYVTQKTMAHTYIALADAIQVYIQTMEDNFVAAMEGYTLIELEMWSDISFDLFLSSICLVMGTVVIFISSFGYFYFSHSTTLHFYIFGWFCFSFAVFACAAGVHEFAVKNNLSSIYKRFAQDCPTEEVLNIGPYMFAEFAQMRFGSVPEGWNFFDGPGESWYEDEYFVFDAITLLHNQAQCSPNLETPFYDSWVASFQAFNICVSLLMVSIFIYLLVGAAVLIFRQDWFVKWTMPKKDLEIKDRCFALKKEGGRLVLEPVDLTFIYDYQKEKDSKFFSHRSQYRSIRPEQKVVNKYRELPDDTDNMSSAMHFQI